MVDDSEPSTLDVGLVGIGSLGIRLGRQFTELPGSELVALADENLPFFERPQVAVDGAFRVAEFVRQFGDADMFSGLQELDDVERYLDRPNCPPGAFVRGVWHTRRMVPPPYSSVPVWGTLAQATIVTYPPRRTSGGR